MVRFHTINGLFSYYHELLASVQSCRTNMPDPESIRGETFISDPFKKIDSYVYKMTVIGDIGIYLKRLPWYERLILMNRLVAPGEAQFSWGKIVKLLKKEGKQYPRRLNHRGHVLEEYRDKLKPMAEEYFRGKGYL